jgi:N-acetylglucosaminyl-diphospho-decaprenol L-rhamnosyltransferase
MGTDVAVVIGNYQGEHLLPDCLSSLTTQTQAPAEVIVVDAGSTDASAEVARTHDARVVEVENRGLGFLYNRGADATEASLVLFLNNDVALDPGCIEQLASALDAEPARFAADPRQLDWEGERTIHAHTTLSPGRLVREYLPGLHLDPVSPADGIVETVSAHGAAMLVRRDFFNELGGFDETFFMEWEDLDLCWRAWLHGWPSVYVPAAVLRHRVGAATPAAAMPRRSASSHHNLLRFALKCLPPRAAATVVLGELARLPAHPRAISRGLGAVIGEVPEILRIRRSIAPDQATYDKLLTLARPS